MVVVVMAAPAEVVVVKVVVVTAVVKVAKAAMEEVVVTVRWRGTGVDVRSPVPSVSAPMHVFALHTCQSMQLVSVQWHAEGLLMLCGSPKVAMEEVVAARVAVAATCVVQWCTTNVSGETCFSQS